MNNTLIRKLVGGVAPTVVGLTAMVLTAGCARDAASMPSSASPTTFDPLPRPPYSYVDQFDGDNRLKVLEITGAVDAIVDTTGLKVDVACAREWKYYATPQTMRIRLLATGCAKVTIANPSAEELAAQRKAQKQKLGLWQTSESSSTSVMSPSTPGGSNMPVESKPSVIANFLNWLGRNWFEILSIFLTLLGLTWIGKAINRWRHKWKVDVIFTGLRGAGKTELWTAWRDDMTPNLNAKPTPVIKLLTNLPAIPLGDHTLYPKLVDTSGADPAAILNFMMKRNASRRHKLVLIFVIAPCGSKAAGSSTLDHDYVIKQSGYASFPRAILGAASKRIKPNLVVLFLTKFDLLSRNSPEDTTNSDLRTQVHQEHYSKPHVIEKKNSPRAASYASR